MESHSAGIDIDKIESTIWKIQNEERTFELEEDKVIEKILGGEIGYFAKVYDEKSGNWLPVSEKPEFAIAFPIIPFLKLGDGFKNFMKVFEKGLTGIVSIASEPKELIPIAKAFRSQGLPRGVTFFMPILSKDITRRVTRPITMFHVHDNFLVSSFFVDKKIRASTETPLFVFAMNISSSYVSHSMIPYEFPIPDAEKSKLSFDVPPKKWVLKCLRLDTTGSKHGPHKIEFRTASRAERAAKAAVAAALTLGVLRHDSGYKGFSILFEIIPPDSIKTIAEHLEKGELLYRINDYWAAQEELQAAVDLEPANPKAYKMLGIVYSLLNDNEKAEHELKEAINLDQNDDETHNNLGAVFDKMNRAEEAEKEFQEAIRIKPNDLINRYNLAVFYGKRDRFDEAKKEYLEMLKLDPKFLPAYSGFFSLLMKTKAPKKESLRQIYSEAETIFAEAIARLPNEANMHSYLGYVQLHLRKFSEAEREFNVALRLDQRNQLAQAFLALKRKGEWEKIGIGA